jgi:hypothetical protein
MNYALLALLSIVPLAAAVTYTYDSAGRLTSVDYGNRGTISYNYDNAGNLLSRTVASPASGPTTAPQNTDSPKAPVAEKRRPISRTAKPRSKGN